MKKIFGFFASAIQKGYALFSDNFNRTTSGSLGTSSSGGVWEAIRGTWFADGSKAKSNDSASTYPIAAVPMSSSDTTTNIIGTTNGTGAALWVTDSGNWWAVVTSQGSGVSCNCQTCSQCNAYTSVCNAYTTQCNSTSWVCNSWANSCNSSSCASSSSNCAGYSTNIAGYTCSSRSCRGFDGKGFCISGYNCFNPYPNYTTNCFSWTSTCNAWQCNSTSSFCAGSSTVCNAYTRPCSTWGTSCSSWSTYSCNCSTCYPSIIRIIKSVSSTVSEVTSQTVSSAGTFINSIRVTTSGNQITAKAYSDTAQTSQVGSDLVHTATGAAITTKFGIVVAPSTYSQGSTIDSMDVTSN